MAEAYNGPERRTGPASRRMGEGGRFSDRRKRERGVHHIPERRQNDGRRTTCGDFETGDFTGLRRWNDRQAYDKWLVTEAGKE